MAGGGGPVDGGAIAAEAFIEKPRDATDRRDADAREVVNTPIRQVFLQQFDDVPAIDQRLQFRRSTQILEKPPILVSASSAWARSAGVSSRLGFTGGYQCNSVLAR